MILQPPAVSFLILISGLLDAVEEYATAVKAHFRAMLLNFLMCSDLFSLYQYIKISLEQEQRSHDLGQGISVQAFHYLELWSLPAHVNQEPPWTNDLQAAGFELVTWRWQQDNSVWLLRGHRGCSCSSKCGAQLLHPVALLPSNVNPIFVNIEVLEQSQGRELPVNGITSETETTQKTTEIRISHNGSMSEISPVDPRDVQAMKINSVAVEKHSTGPVLTAVFHKDEMRHCYE
ncbi:hypothetical protein Anapl_14279 [Anas platyrhynchos]|uniref:Uncharacterized protein n=1 Tax=Anas platyrhynchos TaxID=8839 RepID=R0LQD1_ANAPL|nr:hypothetical protein Anapl_14279 [Anas platyrhynchos]